MQRSSFFLLTFLLLLHTAVGICQYNKRNVYTLNQDNGLPDNKIYCINVDKHGYVWIGTPKGVVRYNGYTCKTFNLSDGLPSEDVWDIAEDSKGRMWLGSITNGVGYIKNNTYHKCYLDGLGGTIYPRGLREVDGRMIFITLYQGELDQYSICHEHNDTIRKMDIRESLFRTKSDRPHDVVEVMILGKGDVFAVYNTRLYELKPGLSEAIKKGAFEATHTWTLPDSLYKWEISHSKLYFRNSIIHHRDDGKTSWFERYDIARKTHTLADLGKWGIHERLEYMFPTHADDRLYAITRSQILIFDTNIALVSTIQIQDRVTDAQVDGTVVRAVNTGNSWPLLLGTTNKGAWISYDEANPFRETRLALTDYQFVGGAGSTSYLWNGSKKNLASLKHGKLVSVTAHPEFVLLTKMIPYSTDTMFCCSKFIAYYTGSRRVPLATMPVHNTVDAVRVGDTLFLVSPYGFSKVVPGIYHGNISYDRYNGVSFDALRKKVWAYSNGKICIYDKGSIRYLSREKIAGQGSSQIKNILFDSIYGNTFIQRNHDLIVYDQERNVTMPLFKNFNTEDAILSLHKSKIFLAGRFGLLSATINGRNSIAEPTVYQNIKDINYKHAQSMYIDDSLVLLQTDKGIFSLVVPDTATPSKTVKPRLLVYYKDSVISIDRNNTISLDPLNLSFTFDVVNPFGNGAVKYQYKFAEDSGWRTLNANQMVLPGDLKRGTAHLLRVRYGDNVWQSDDIVLSIFINPYWWQTWPGRQIIVVSGVLFLVALLTIAVLLTRRLVVRSEQKRHLQMELELKAIYSQINPHFIFNSLNSALLLVSKNEMENAYAHISKFSRLLRSYLRSSRTKFIAVKEEADNLADYIELQQVRFKNRFTYDISVDEQLITSSAKIPSLLVQPFVENAINHGLLNTSAPGHLAVAFKADGDIITCIIDDNGVGRNVKETTHHGAAGSFGNLMINDLVNIFNKYEHMNITVSYIDKSQPATGTTVIIRIKVDMNNKI